MRYDVMLNSFLSTFSIIWVLNLHLVWQNRNIVNIFHFDIHFCLSIRLHLYVCVNVRACMRNILEVLAMWTYFHKKKKSANRNSNWFSFVVVLVLFHWGGGSFTFFFHLVSQLQNVCILIYASIWVSIKPLLLT